MSAEAPIALTILCPTRPLCPVCAQPLSAKAWHVLYSTLFCAPCAYGVPSLCREAIARMATEPLRRYQCFYNGITAWVARDGQSRNVAHVFHGLRPTGAHRGKDDTAA